MNIGFIGAGKVGFSLGRFMLTKNIRVIGYYSLHAESAIEAAEFTHTNYFSSIEELSDESDVIFITVPDGAICSVYEQIKNRITGKYLCHCSGLMTASEAFPDIEKYGAYGCSIHPLFPISSKYDTYRELQDAFFCLENGDNSGKNETENVIFSLLRQMGVKLLRIDAHNKAKYHAACAIASNLVCGIEQIAMNLLGECGFDAEESLGALRPLILSNTSHILRDGPQKALTGPVQRKDAGTVKKHLDCLEGRNREIYRLLSKQLLMMTDCNNNEYGYKEIEILLSK